MERELGPKKREPVKEETGVKEEYEILEEMLRELLKRSRIRFFSIDLLQNRVFNLKF